uniref:Uncharacterized protein n=1 Tax=Rhizophora mucronata TaxID=61149 RepID=A0A2P2QNZ8_RHIMU
MITTIAYSFQLDMLTFLFFLALSIHPFHIHSGCFLEFVFPWSSNLGRGHGIF